MYEKFYRFNTVPFRLTPDSRFFFGSSGHSRAIAHLVYGLAQQEGFIVITGEVGAGKTTLFEQAWSQLDRSTYLIARVVTTRVSGDDLLRLAMANFGLNDVDGADKSALLRRFEHFAREQISARRRCVLVVDEVQNLPLAALEELRMLSNITIDGRASVQTILLGQPQFRAVLASPDLEQLRQRVLASYHLGPLTRAETRLYIEHRLRTAGWNGDPQWSDEAFDAVFHHSDGIPRRINTLCSRILLYGALEETHTISGSMALMTAGELDQDLGAGLAVVPPPTVASSADPKALLGRIDALEQGIARQDRMVRRVLDLLGAAGERG